MIELSITIKDESRTYVDKDIIYDPLTFDRNNPEIIKRVKDAIQAFPGPTDIESPDITIRAKMVW